MERQKWTKRIRKNLLHSPYDI